ncbi:MAG: LysR substrate-binding domain-containing protein [Pseudomonadota bacterium]
MLKNNLNTIDLNLLKVVAEIEKQGSVSRAAEALGVGQPAVSQALSRLRQTFNDQLFERGEGGMVPTPRMEELIGPVRAALEQIEQSVFGEQDFDPRQTKTRYFIGASDYAAALIVPSLMPHLAQSMPGADLSLRPCDRTNAFSLLSNSEIDLAIGLFTDVPKWFRRRRLFRERHVCVYDPAMVELPDELTLEAFAVYDHLLVSLDGSPTGFVDEILQAAGFARRVRVTTPFFLQAADILRTLPVIASLPERFVAEHASMIGLSRRILPFQASGFDISMLWRASDDRNPRQNNLRDVILSASRYDWQKKPDLGGKAGLSDTSTTSQRD